MFRSKAQNHKKKISVAVLHEEEPCERVSASCLPLVKIESQRERAVRRMHGRIILMSFAFAMVFAVLILRLGEISLSGPVRAPETRVIAFALHDDNDLPRAELTDRNGNRLMMNAPTIGVAIESRNVWDAKETAAGIAKIFPSIDADRLAEKICTNAYIFLRNDISADERTLLLHQGLPGVKFVEGTKRVYPQGALAAHIVGQYIPGRGGVMGLEGAIDSANLHGTIAASIDISAQQILEEELEKALVRFQAKAAWGVILDARNGEVIALASLPDFNPNHPGDFPARNRRNAVMYDRYELGSVFKPLTAAALLESGAADMDSLYDVSHPLKIGGRTISDFTPKGHALNFVQVLQYSSNIGAARMAEALGIERQQYYLRALGLLDPLQTELPEKRASAYPERWGPVESATIAYGHGIAVTPLQLAAAFVPVVNGGTYYTPTFFKQEKPREDGRQVFSPKTSAAMRIALRKVVTDGTGKRAEAPGYYAIGKTGTADKPSASGGYKENARLSSFIGAIPGYDPRFVILISFDEPTPSVDSLGWATASVVAAPVFRNVASRLGPVFGINPVGDDRAFAGFVRAFRQNDETRLAFADEHDRLLDAEVDPLGALIAGLEQ